MESGNLMAKKVKKRSFLARNFLCGSFVLTGKRVEVNIDRNGSKLKTIFL